MVTQIEQHTAEIDGVRVAYQTAGAGQPVILIHGLSGSVRWWARNVAALAAHFRVYVVDLPGFGASRGSAPFVLAQASWIIAQWMAQLGIARAHIIGHSMGGFIAAELAADSPQCVDRLVLVAPAVTVYGLTMRRGILGLVRQARYTPFKLLPLILADAYRSNPRAIWAGARALLTTDLRPKLARIHAPTLVVWGTHDTLVPAETAPVLAAAIAGAQLTMIAGAGHNTMLEQAEKFNRVVLAFLEQPGARS